MELKESWSNFYYLKSTFHYIGPLVQDQCIQVVGKEGKWSSTNCQRKEALTAIVCEMIISKPGPKQVVTKATMKDAGSPFDSH